MNIILRAADLRIFPAEYDCSHMQDVLCLRAKVESAMYIGSKYKHVIRFKDQTILADWDENFSGKDIQLIEPRDKIRIFK